MFNEANAYSEELKEDEQEKPEEGDVRLRGRSCGCRVSPPILPHKPLQVLMIKLFDQNHLRQGIEKCECLSLILRDDPKPRVDCDRHEDMDAAHSRIELQFEATKASFPCKCKNCPQMARPEEQVCCLGESQWQDLYNTGGKEQ